MIDREFERDQSEYVQVKSRLTRDIGLHLRGAECGGHR